MNMRTFHKLSEEILNSKDEENDKENYINNAHEEMKAKRSGEGKGMGKQQVLNMKRMNAKRVQEITLCKDKEIEEMRNNYEKEKRSLIDKYEKIVQEKEEYIKVLEELYSNEPVKEATAKTTLRQSSKPQLPPSTIKSFGQTLYLHQAPLYNEICYSIQRPSEGRGPMSELFCTQKIKNRITSNQKSKNEGSISGSKVRSQSTNRCSSSKHGLMPACPPKYSKIL